VIESSLHLQLHYSVVHLLQDDSRCTTTTGTSSVGCVFCTSVLPLHIACSTVARSAFTPLLHFTCSFTAVSSSISALLRTKREGHREGQRGSAVHTFIFSFHSVQLLICIDSKQETTAAASGAQRRLRRAHSVVRRTQSTVHYTHAHCS
jgi:hypothetical protein